MGIVDQDEREYCRFDRPEANFILFERVESEGLAHYSYIVSDGNEAVVIDPRQDCDIYSKMAKKEGMRIASVLETHRIKSAPSARWSSHYGPGPRSGTPTANSTTGTARLSWIE